MTNGNKLKFKVASYDVFLWREFSIPGTTAKFIGGIVCKATRSGDGEFWIGFLAAGSRRPSNSYDPATKKGFSFLPAAHYSAYINLLQCGSDVYAYLDKDIPSSNGLTTDRTPLP
jgi:hypothetical protein